MTMLRSLLIAVQFLTRIPVRLAEPASDTEMGQSVLWYPAVGLLVGLPGASIAAWSIHVAHGRLVAAALVVLISVLMSGGLHLDGLADSADAWAGCGGDPQRALEIMKDPRCGPIGASALILVLLAKFAAVADLIAEGHAWPVLLAPALARAGIPLLLATTPYVRRGGLGEGMAAHLPRRAAPVGAIVVLGFGVWCEGIVPTLGIGATFALVGWLLRRMMMRAIGGTTGDTAGAFVELIETAVIVAAAL